MGFFPHDLEQVYDNATENKIGVRGGDTQTNQRLAGTTQNGLPVILC